MTDGWGVFAALATAASAAFIGWQAWLTRKSVDASEKALAVSSDSVDISNKALHAAERSADIAEATLRATQIARLDAYAPDIRVLDSSYRASSLQMTADTGPFYEWSVIPDWHVFKLPRDADVQIAATVSLQIENRGSRPVTLRVARPAFWAPPVEIPAGVTAFAHVDFVATVSQWIAKINEGTKAPMVAEVVYKGFRDMDVDEVVNIDFNGSVLEEVADARGDWRVIADGEFDTPYPRVHPPVRTYWKSRSADEQF